MCGDNSGRGLNGETHVSMIDLPVELMGFLETVRMLLAGQMGIARQDGFVASDIAEAWYGRSEGLAITAATMDLLLALRHSRRSAFRFSNPTCPVCREYLTRHEILLVRVMLHVAKGKTHSACADALALCEGFDENPLLHEARRVSSLIKGSQVVAPVFGQRVIH
jgi:hypothetical protein